MSKRKSNSIGESPHKRVRPTEVYDENNEAAGILIVSAVTKTLDLTVGEVGIVESISLKNFMCHSLLGPFAFGSNVNFVVGNNGSGKSAVLTALMVGLGGKATTTNRGSSLKGFVKEGESSADVSITLRNKGRDAYKPEVFGQAIIVDLKITREGMRTYKLKSKAGHLVSAKKDELLAILDHFNIQVDNPVSMLTQEMSKHFLHSKGEGDKYRFFMKATQLEQMKEDYTYIITTKNVTLDTVEKHEECLEGLKRKYLEKEDRVKSLASLDDMHSKLEELKNQMAWALVSEMEKEVKPMREKLQSEERSTVKYDQKVDEWKAKVVEAEKKYKGIREQLEAITVRVQQLEPQSAQLKNEAQSRSKAFNTAQASVHRFKTNLRDLEKDKDQLSRRINELKLSISQTSGAETQVRVERMEKLQTDLDTLNFQDSTLGQQMEQFQQAVSRAKDELDKMMREEEDLKRSMEAIRRKLQTMEGSRSDRLRRFGEKMPALLAAIEDADRKGQFRKKPVGPLGYCIRLKDYEQALAVEKCLGSLMVAFTCDNHEDEKLLQGLMRGYYQGGRRPQIITCQFINRVHDTSRRAVNHPDYPSVLQSLEIEDPVVANCLIDQRGIETILLIKSPAEARRVMQGRQPPRNCYQAFTKEGDQCYNNRYYSNDQRRCDYLSRDVEEEIRQLQEEMRNKEAHLDRFSQQKQRVEEDIRNNNGLLKRAYDDRKKAKDKFRRLQQEISDLQNVEEPQSEDLKPLEEELEEINNKISAGRAESEEARRKMAQLKTSWEEVEQRYRQHKDSISTVAEEAEPIKEELSKGDQDVEKSKHHKKHYEDKRKVHINTIQALKASLELKEQELTASVVKATEICPERSEVRRTARSLDSEISRLKLKISTQQDQQGDREEVIRQYQEALENYSNINQQVKCLKRFIQVLCKIMDDRHRVYTELRRFLSVRCKMYFDSMLSQRGYIGKMMFEHKNETLSISVQPGVGDKAALSDMRSLSGGERSFSTVCFVLSLWAIAEAPFRALDEFDVYMDMVNRRISMDMMLKIASSQRYRQFIFLTPQSMSSLPVNNLIRILRLKDPDRGQTALPFGQRNEEEEEKE
ncbi:structural maintenance of chromosomes protein 6-like isoform X2 [Salvelinus fontinalis]|uniref:structural maintenance of chromosomes protein 6-like isoform X2 n=1 Tax=Salvelinus fontinalis TaxID=8038 RepID=UPI00248632B4|nr:structural maintenance of chromosomes protein 6-like isoform X2 [Salvelinus fontinalis]